MNLEVDVMEGDEFTECDGDVYHYRGKQYRRIGFGHVDEWEDAEKGGQETPIDLPTFTRYCEGCGLTVKHVKPEPKVETIKPPEFACRCVASGKVRFYTTQDGRDKCVQSAKNWQAVRIDWGAK